MKHCEVTIQLVFFSSKYRKGWDPCAWEEPRQDPNQTSQEYEQPTVTAETAVTDDDTIYQYAEMDDPNFAVTNEDSIYQYAEMDDPNFAGYKNQISNWLLWSFMNFN